MTTIKAIAALLFLLLSLNANSQETSNYEFAVRYVQGLATTYDLQVGAKKEYAEATNPQSKLLTGIRSSTRLQIELRSMIGVLQASKPNDDAAPFVKALIDCYQQKIDLHNMLIEIATKMLSGPEPGVNYGKLAATMPQISATLDAVDKSIFQLANAFFGIMIDEKADRNGHASHLTITKDQRKRLVSTINMRFGSSLNSKDQNWTVSAAWLMRSNLLKDFKSSDDHW